MMRGRNMKVGKGIIGVMWRVVVLWRSGMEGEVGGRGEGLEERGVVSGGRM